MREVLREGLAFAVAGCVAGLAGAAIAARLLQSQLYAVHPRDPITYGASLALLLCGAALACSIPALSRDGHQPDGRAADRVSHDPARRADEERTAAVVGRQRALMSGSCSAPASREIWRRSRAWWRRTRRSCAPTTNTGRRCPSPCGRTGSTSRRSCSIAVRIRLAWAATSSKRRATAGTSRWRRCSRAGMRAFTTPRRRENPSRRRFANATRKRCGRLLDETPELLHAGDGRSSQPIHWAVMTRQIDIIDDLLRRGANIDARRQDGAHPVELTNGDYFFRGWRDVPKEIAPAPDDVLAHLLARGAYCDIWTAAHLGDLARVRELLDQDPSLVNRVADYVNTGRHWSRLPPEGTSRLSGCCSSAAPIRTCPRKAMRRTAVRCIQPSTTDTSRSPGSCWNMAPIRIRRSKARRTR